MRVAGLALFLTTFVVSHLAVAELSRVEITSRETLSDPSVLFSYEKIEGIMHFALLRIRGLIRRSLTLKMHP